MRRFVILKKNGDIKYVKFKKYRKIKLDNVVSIFCPVTNNKFPLYMRFKPNRVLLEFDKAEVVFKPVVLNNYYADDYETDVLNSGIIRKTATNIVQLANIFISMRRIDSFLALMYDVSIDSGHWDECMGMVIESAKVSFYRGDELLDEASFKITAKNMAEVYNGGENKDFIEAFEEYVDFDKKHVEIYDSEAKDKYREHTSSTYIFEDMYKPKEKLTTLLYYTWLSGSYYAIGNDELLDIKNNLASFYISYLVPDDNLSDLILNSNYEESEVNNYKLKTELMKYREDGTYIEWCMYIRNADRLLNIVPSLYAIILYMDTLTLSLGIVSGVDYECISIITIEEAPFLQDDIDQLFLREELQNDKKLLNAIKRAMYTK